MDYDKLEAYGLSLPRSRMPSSARTSNSPGGNVDVDAQTFSVRATGLAQAPEDIGDYVVATTPRAGAHAGRGATSS